MDTYTTTLSESTAEHSDHLVGPCNYTVQVAGDENFKPLVSIMGPSFVLEVLCTYFSTHRKIGRYRGSI